MPPPGTHIYSLVDEAVTKYINSDQVRLNTLGAPPTNVIRIFCIIIHDKGVLEMKTRTYSKSIAEAINTFLTEDNWNFRFNENNGIFEFNLGPLGEIRTINFTVLVREDDYSVYATLPLGAAIDNKQQLSSMAEFICRANYGLKSGCFEFDMRDGEIGYKHFTDCEEITPTQAMIANSIYRPAAMFDTYGKGILDILFKDMSAEEAIDRCESYSETSSHEEKHNSEELETMLAQLEARLNSKENNSD